VSFPGEGGDVSLPGEGPHAMGIDRKANRRRAPTTRPFICTDGSEVPHAVGIDRKANRRQATDASAAELHRSEAAA
jgi:hypothetical protein